ncbi:MAG: PKD domain-containing protein [Bacteroidetes bacterium]|nr:PKD domain-containing protein [Bacteroidota bacterium]
MKILLTWILLSISSIAFSQEICNNGIDDDGNGLIDLNDPACSCTPLTVQPPSMIPNHSFEQMNCCPTSFSQVNCATGWIQASSATSDYHNCSYNSTINTPAFPYPDGTGYMGFWDFNNGFGVWKEYVGSCLLSPMIAGQTYEITFDIAVGYGSEGVPGPYPPLNFTIFGASSCGALPWAGTNCPSGSWIPLVSQLIPTSTPNPSPIPWQNITLIFTPSTNIYAVALGSSCGAVTNTYSYIDNLVLNQTTSFNASLQETGGWCTDNLQLFSPDAPLGTYQWYKDGIALSGEINDTLNLSLGGYTDGYYTLKIDSGGTCYVVSGTVSPKTSPVANFTAANLCYGSVSSFTDLSTISIGSIVGWDWDAGDGIGTSTAQNPAYTYGDTGTYTVTLIVTSSQGCKDTIFGTGTVFDPPVASFAANTVCEGSTTVFTDSSTSSVSTIVGWDWDAGDGIGTTTTQNPTYVYAGAGNYNATLTVTDGNGCTDDTLITVSVVSPPATPVTCAGNVLVNPSFEDPIVPVLNGNNLIGSSIPGWTTQFGGTFNLIKVNGTAYASGADNAATGNQYVDIVNSSDYPTQSFTLARTSTLSFSGYFSNRESANGGYVSWTARVDILDASSTVVSSSNTFNFTSVFGDETWVYLSGTSAPLPAGTYRYRAFISDYGHFDEAFLCITPSVCEGDTIFLNASTIAGAAYSWTGPNAFTSTQQNPMIINATPAMSGTYTVTVSDSSVNCPGNPDSTIIVVDPLPTVTVPTNINVCSNEIVAATNFISSPTGGTFSWTNDNTSIGIGASGVGNIPAFNAINNTASPITATIIVTSTVASVPCPGISSSYTITIYPTSAFTQVLSGCQGFSVSAGTNTYTTTGIFIDTLVSANGCDSILTTNLTINPISTITQNVSGCQGFSIAVGVNTYSSTGIYIDTLIATTGCDSIVTTNLTITNSSILNLGNDTCFSAPFTLDATSNYDIYTWQDASTANTFNVLVPDTYYCEVGTIGGNLIYNGDFELGNTGFSSQYNYTSGTVMQGGYDINTTTATGWWGNCNDHTSSSGNMMIVDAACGTNGVSGGADLWCQTVNVTQNTDYIFSAWAANAANSASTALLGFFIDGVQVGTTLGTSSVSCQWNQMSQIWNSGMATTVTICIRELTFICSGADFIMDDVYFAPICYQTDTIHVFPSPTVSYTQSNVCEGLTMNFANTSSISSGAISTYSWNFGDGIGNANVASPSYTYGNVGQYPVTLTATSDFGCVDSITQMVTVLPISTFTQSLIECPGFSVTVAANTYNTTGIFTDTLTSANGCDSILTTDLTIKPISTFTQVLSGCQGFNVMVGTNTYNTTGIYTDTLIAANGCDSILTTDLTIESISNFTQVLSGCQGFNVMVGANTYNTTGIFTDTLIATNGCDSILTTDLTINPQPTAAYTFTNVCFGTTTGFTDLSNGNGGTINQWAWDFTNNGSVDNATQNPTNGYASAGSYTVELLVTTTDGCKDSITRVVVVNPIPVADFTATTECLGNTTTFTDASTVTTGSITNWAWDFGDTGTDATQNPTHIYTASGNFNTVLTVTSDSGCINNYNTNVTVYSNPIASFTADEACLTLETSFTDSSIPGDNPISIWDWDFQNNGSVDISEQSPTFIFPTSGIHNVNLYVEDSQGCNHDTVLTITVSENPIANFTYSNECFGTATTFTDLSSNNGGTTNIDTWQWDFDGNGSIDDATPNPTNTFPLAGTYQTELFVTSTLGCKDSMTIAVVVNPIPVANFTATSECFEYTTTFTNTSTITTGTIAQNDWDFDDAIGTSALLNPTYIYGSSGTFNVELIVTSDSGCTHSVIVPVTVYPKPTANFDTTDVCLNIAAQFTDQSIDNGGILNGWTWDFENDGVVDNSTTQNPSHYYLAAGTYTIELIASTTDGCKDTINKTVTIHPMPVADFTYIDACFNQDIVFTNISTVSAGTVDVWDWQFGDAQTSALEDPLHNYASEGVYNVQLIVATNNNCSDTIIKNGIEVWPLPYVNFGPTSVCLNDSTQFTDSSTVSNIYTVNNNVTYSWDFADGIGTSNDQHPIYMYTTDGIFNATLTVTTDHNCENDTTLPVTVHPLPVVDFTPDIQNGCTPVYVTFTDLTDIQNTDGSFINEWDWDFNGDGITDNINPSPPYNFTNPSHSSVRDFDIRLITTSNFGCKDTLIKEDYIHSYPIPLASFMYWPNDEASIVDNDITFTDQSIIGSVFNWDLGDGTLTTVQHPVHEYTDTGFYLVTLAIENVYGCRDTTQKYVNIKPIYAIYIPNSFTPNGDNTNDYFYVNGYGIKELQMMIFNRWGEKLYDDIGVDQSWDGVYKGDLVPTDVYVYKVRAKDVFDEWHNYIGKVTVIK